MNWDYESIINLSTNSVAFSDDMCLSGGGSWHTKNQNIFFIHKVLYIIKLFLTFGK